MGEMVKQEGGALATLDAQSVEKLVIGGDLATLNSEQKVSYYKLICERVGVDAATRPFEYIKLNGKVVLYARRDCTDQLRVVHGVSVIDMKHERHDGIYAVTVKVQNGKGRSDMATGVVQADGLKGEALANAIMKAETKAKRRATLSLCGLGMLDETELESVPAAGDIYGVADSEPTPAKKLLEARAEGEGSDMWRAACEAVALRDLNGLTLTPADIDSLRAQVRTIATPANLAAAVKWMNDKAQLEAVTGEDGSLLEIKVTERVQA